MESLDSCLVVDAEDEEASLKEQCASFVEGSLILEDSLHSSSLSLVSVGDKYKTILCTENPSKQAVNVKKKH